MPIFKIVRQRLVPIKETRLELEKDVQKITEENLETVFGLKFVCSEFSLQNLRLDTLAFDKETSSFIIIEYKRDRSSSVIDQGYAYLGLLLERKADFVLEYNRRLKKGIEKEDIDWSQSRVIFIANSFTNYQQRALNFKDLPIELWEVKKFDNDTVLYNQLKTPDSSESIKLVSKNKIAKVNKEIKHYSIEDHFKNNWVGSRETFDELRERILNLDNRIEESPQKYYIGYKIEKNNFVSIIVQKGRIILELLRVKPNPLKDPERRTIYNKNSFKYYHQHITQFPLERPTDSGYAMFLVKQIYKKFYR